MKKQNKNANIVGKIGELDPGLIKIGYMKLLKCKEKIITNVELYEKNILEPLQNTMLSKKVLNQFLVCG